MVKGNPGWNWKIFNTPSNPSWNSLNSGADHTFLLENKITLKVQCKTLENIGIYIINDRIVEVFSGSPTGFDGVFYHLKECLQRR